MMAFLAQETASSPVKQGSLREDLVRWTCVARALCDGRDDELAIIKKVEAALPRNLIDRSDFVHAAFGARRADGIFQVTGFESSATFGAGAMRLGMQQDIRDADELRSVRNTAEEIARLLKDLHTLLAARMP